MRTGESTLENCLILCVASSIICKGSIYVIIKMFFLLLKTRNMHKEETGFLSGHPIHLQPIQACLQWQKENSFEHQSLVLLLGQLPIKYPLCGLDLGNYRINLPAKSSEGGQPNRSEVVIIPVLCLEHLLSLLR